MTSNSEVRAEDIMQTEVITLPVDAPIHEAVQTFEEFNIKGAPVVDGAGNLVGVLTASDISKSSHMRGDRLEGHRGQYYLTDPLDELGPDGSRTSEEFMGKDDYSTELLGSEVVGDWMTPRVISVRPAASIRELCQTMTRESIHRVLVVQNSRIVGIVTSIDVVRHMAGEDRGS